MMCLHFDPKHTPARHVPNGKDLENQDYHLLIRGATLMYNIRMGPPGEFLKIGDDEPR